MDAFEVPHFHNKPGADYVRIGVREFMCIGALPPFDHPHVFLTMGEVNETICPYCATHYVHDASLGDQCDPPECAYKAERETDLSPPLPSARREPESEPAAPPPRADLLPDISVRGRGLVGVFASEHALFASARKLSDNDFAFKCFMPNAPSHKNGASPLPTAILIAGFLGAIVGFGMQSYANIVSYPLDIGGRPAFSWPSFMPIAFETGALSAVVTGVIGYMFAARLFKFYDSIDALGPMQRAMCDAFVVLVDAPEIPRRHRALEILRDAGARGIEEIDA